jgi:hypothetical protein
MYACMYVCMYACMYVCMYMYAYSFFLEKAKRQVHLPPFCQLCELWLNDYHQPLSFITRHIDWQQLLPIIIDYCPYLRLVVITFD